MGIASMDDMTMSGPFYSGGPEVLPFKHAREVCVHTAPVTARYLIKIITAKQDLATSVAAWFSPF